MRDILSTFLPFPLTMFVSSLRGGQRCVSSHIAELGQSLRDVPFGPSPRVSSIQGLINPAD